MPCTLPPLHGREGPLVLGQVMGGLNALHPPTPSRQIGAACSGTSGGVLCPALSHPFILAPTHSPPHHTH